MYPFSYICVNVIQIYKSDLLYNFGLDFCCCCYFRKTYVLKFTQTFMETEKQQQNRIVI